MDPTWSPNESNWDQKMFPKGCKNLSKMGCEMERKVDPKMFKCIQIGTGKYPNWIPNVAKQQPNRGVCDFSKKASFLSSQQKESLGLRQQKSLRMLF